jgi:hypothetical protein
MRNLIPVTMILGACFVLVVGLLSVLHDLLVRSPMLMPSELERRNVGRERSTACGPVSEDIQ